MEVLLSTPPLPLSTVFFFKVLPGLVQKKAGLESEWLGSNPSSAVCYLCVLGYKPQFLIYKNRSTVVRAWGSIEWDETQKALNEAPTPSWIQLNLNVRIFQYLVQSNSQWFQLINNYGSWTMYSEPRGAE